MQSHEKTDSLADERIHRANAAISSGGGVSAKVRTWLAPLSVQTTAAPAQPGSKLTIDGSPSVNALKHSSATASFASIVECDGKPLRPPALAERASRPSAMLKARTMAAASWRL